MALPELVLLASKTEYRDYYLNQYCRAVIRTFDGVRVFFGADKFGHAFSESSARDGNKDSFSAPRAERIAWIRYTLEAADAQLFQGWNKDAKTYEPDRRVAVAYEDYVVVVDLSLNAQGELKGQFVTAYVADNSIEKIFQSPIWTLEDCLRRIADKNRR